MLAKRQVCVLRLGLELQFGIKLAKRQVFVNENLRIGHRIGFGATNLGINLAKPVVCVLRLELELRIWRTTGKTPIGRSIGINLKIWGLI
jgi:hypothetical protein